MKTLLRYNIIHLLMCVLIASIVLPSCNNNTEVSKTMSFEIKDFTPLFNWEQKIKTDTHTLNHIELDYIDALQGFEIPSVRQLENGFEYRFFIKNTSPKDQFFNYKIYYQNESYKFPEHSEKRKDVIHELSFENFYGSWENTDCTFVKTPIIPADGIFHEVKGFIKIVGNPRNEKMFFQESNNQRWRRNPRVGLYSFMLVVSPNSNIEKKVIPEYIQNISLLKNEQFENPYYYFLYGDGASLPDISVILKRDALKVTAQPNLGGGIYINFGGEEVEKDFTSNCGRSPDLTKNACFEQFRHYVDESSKFNNIPVIKDVIKDDYTFMEYNWNKSFFREEELVRTWPQVAKCPCKNVISDKEQNKLKLINPKSTYGNWKKENAGVRTRHGFTYGTYTVKAKLTRLLSNSGVWNGIVNTIWLLNQSNEEWNRRRVCRKEGYLETYWGGPNDKRVPYVSYSEIDFEILKTVSYCPPHAFPPVYLPSLPNKDNLFSWHTTLPDELHEQKDDIIVACTNWDMACWEPDKFDVGCHPISYQGQTFYNHRWDHWYRAITQKSPEKDAELFGADFYYFQIEWNPTEIIWRIGPEKNKLRVVGYVNSTVTSIPNNQMLLIITQEFHSSRWWVGAPFQQQFIPFPENEIVGEIFELIIE